MSVSANDGIAIRAEGVAKAYGTVIALDAVDLEVETGTVMALLGPNGAGKTTLVRILTTLLRPDSGSIRVGPYDLFRESHAVRNIIGSAGQAAAVDEKLTGRENLELVGRLYHLGRSTARKRADELLHEFELTDAAHRQAKTYSGGMRRRLDLAASLVGKPRILFLDEPTTGLDPQSRLNLWLAIEELVAGGVTVLLTTQYLDEADYLADQIAVIDQGKIIARGTPDELKSRVGSDVLELRVRDRSTTSRAAEAIRNFGTSTPSIDAETGRVVLPISNGAALLAEVVRELDAARVEIAEFNLRRSSLDEVFLTLTGQGAGGAE